ncbi:MAG TPA: non-canonical purine NTP pyrophosphatase, RdgB/HAM1 family [Clostridiales bacterium UBA8153]|nr:non-canonical purine NTP pyrophosphatase, RdgB/HAM1 family [Clostridiales bacterium UBA8153]
MSRTRAVALLVATRNPGKLREIRTLLPECGGDIIGLDAYPGLVLPPEADTTFVENAVMKVSAAARLTGLPAVADDSGLEVDVLGGYPGVRSAIFAGEHAGDGANNQLLLDLLMDVPDERRTARFVCAIAWGKPGQQPKVTVAYCHGRVLRVPRGTHGFGYDPLFYYPPAGLTFGELSPAAKNAVSHRALALQAARPGIMGMLDDNPGVVRENR